MIGPSLQSYHYTDHNYVARDTLKVGLRKGGIQHINYELCCHSGSIHVGSITGSIFRSNQVLPSAITLI